MVIVVSSLFLVFAVAVAVVDAQRGQTIVERIESDVPSSTDVVYDCDLYNLWTSDRHPVGFPGGAHWTRPVYASHTGQYSMFRQGDIATEGLRRVAERGQTGTLTTELNNAGNRVLSHESAGGFGGSLGDMTTFSVAVDRRHRLLSLSTMIAPSPDWFGGFRRINFKMGNNWAEQVTVNGYPWDAGTQNGTTYSLGGRRNVENPRIPINQIRRRDVNRGNTANGILLSPDGNTVLAVLRLKCTLQGEQGNQCPAEAGQSCSSGATECCTGLSCMADTCQPCLVHRQTTCTSNDDCCPGLRCLSNGRCSANF